MLQQPRAELEYRCKDGGTIWAEVNMSWLLGENGEPVGGIGVSRDITANRNASHELEAYARKLEQVNGELAQATAAANAANQAKDHFLASMSHEFSHSTERRDRNDRVAPRHGLGQPATRLRRSLSQQRAVPAHADQRRP